MDGVLRSSRNHGAGIKTEGYGDTCSTTLMWLMQDQTRHCPSFIESSSINRVGIYPESNWNLQIPKSHLDGLKYQSCMDV